MAQTRYNLRQYNTSRYNGGPLTVTLPTDLVVFEDFSLHNNSTIFIHSIDDSGPSRQMLGSSIPREDGEFLNADYWGKKYVDFQGTVTAASATALEALMDTIRKGLRKPEGNLDITRNSVVRRYKASLVNMNSLFPKREHFHTSWIPFSARFECRTPFAEDREYTNVQEQITTSPVNITTAENTGTIEALPIILCIFDAASSVTVLNIKRIEAATGDTIDEIEYSGTIAAGDVLEFDSENKTVKKNGTEVDYTGSFPKLDVGGNVLTFTTTSTSHDFLATVKYRNRYL